MLQRCISGLEGGNGRVVDLRHGRDLLVLHVGDSVRRHRNLRVLLARLLVRGGIEGQEEEQVR